MSWISSAYLHGPIMYRYKEKPKHYLDRLFSLAFESFSFNVT